ncbi:hypothetical protein [Falsiroseomonas sp. HW251]|uniref:hypothetical protein n=1 Tax=Falsiroseomonas sp. HW251 TaxID=3390998 RepID=UPI003D31606B
MDAAPALLGPFPHGAFLVEPDGGLHPRGRPALRFAWRGRGCEAVVTPRRVRLSAAAGAVPYTAERPEARPGAFALIRSLRRDLPTGWRLRLLPDHALRLEAECDLPEPGRAVALVSALVGFALALDPYLDRLESAGVAPADAASGAPGDAASGAPGTEKT